MIVIRTIEINDEEKDIRIEFSNYFGEIEIDKITDVESGDAICPDLYEMVVSNHIYYELMEYAADHKADRLSV